MFKIMYVRVRENLPYLHTYRTEDGRTEFDRDKAMGLATRVEKQRSNFAGTRVCVVPTNQDSPNHCPWCGSDLKSEGYPIGHQMPGSGELCILKIRD